MDDTGFSTLIEDTAGMVRKKLDGDSSGHDWWHIHRVHCLSKRIGEEEGGVDMPVVELAALLHDISDWKFNGGDEKGSSSAAREWLKGKGVDEQTTEAVCRAIDDVSFKGKGVMTTPGSREGMIVQDADRLDAIGAIGIGRAFAYGGSMGREMYNPSEPPVEHSNFEEYRKSRSHTINHFHEKLLLLRDRMNTETARKIAEGRQGFMLEFLDRFRKEWEGAA